MDKNIKTLMDKWANKNKPDGKMKLAHKIGISYCSLMRIYGGGSIKLKTALALAKELGVKVEELAK